MLIRTMTELESEGRVISISHGKSSAVRLLTKSDGVGFSVSEARASAGEGSDLWYKNHWEANYVRFRPRGSRGPRHRGAMASCARRRVLRRSRPTGTGSRGTLGEAMRIISVFNPPLVGEETHDEDGAYPPTGEIPPGQARMFVRTVKDVREAGREFVVAGGAAVSTRYLTAADNLGFSLHGVRLEAGASAELWYKHHFEANLILDGALDVTDHASGETHRLGPGALYLVGRADRHRIETQAKECISSACSIRRWPAARATTRTAAYPPTGADSTGSGPDVGRAVRRGASACHIVLSPLLQSILTGAGRGNVSVSRDPFRSHDERLDHLVDSVLGLRPFTLRRQASWLVLTTCPSSPFRTSLPANRCGLLRALDGMASASSSLDRQQR